MVRTLAYYMEGRSSIPTVGELLQWRPGSEEEEEERLVLLKHFFFSCSIVIEYVQKQLLKSPSC